MSQNYDLIVIGSGPAGYVGAIHAAQNGLKVGIVEKDPTLGGTCLNVGCIPAKALLFSAQQFDKARRLATYGVNVEGDPKLNFEQVIKRKGEIVKRMTNGVAFLMKKNKIDVLKGHGRIAGRNNVEVEDSAGKKTAFNTKNILIASGSRVRMLPHIEADGKDIITSTEILSLKETPKSLAVLGGGVVGSEFASAYGRFGTDVTIFEMSDQLVPSEDKETAKELEKALKKQNVTIRTGVKVSSMVSKGGSVEVKVEGDAKPLVFEKALISIGRAPNTEDIGLDTVGIQTDRGFINVDFNTNQTSVPGIYAAGDVLTTPQLAHTGSAEAIFAVDAIIGNKRHPIDYLKNPGAIYTYPEIASIGKTEKALKDEGRDYKAAKFPFSAVAKAHIEDCPEGFIKILSDKKYGEILGVHIVHAKATEMIAEFALGQNLETTIEEVVHTIHPHPTLSETVMEAAHAATGHPIHI